MLSRFYVVRPTPALTQTVGKNLAPATAVRYEKEDESGVSLWQSSDTDQPWVSNYILKQAFYCPQD